MRDIIELCIELDTAAIETYDRLATSCEDQGIRHLFEQMGLEERSHVVWWSELLVAWDGGLVPPMPDEDELRLSLHELAADVQATVPVDCSELSTDEMLAIAAQLEFYMLDPAFAELIDLVRPSKQVDVRDAYSRHIMRLVNAIDEHYAHSGLSRFLARALARSLRDQQRLSKLATQDQLTGLYNRRGFYGYLTQWTSYATRYKHPLSVMLVDIDRFKAINDSHGHPAGDAALAAVARALRTAVRTSDLVGRYGGDEFAILAPDTGSDDLVLLMERVLVALRELCLEFDGDRVCLTVSVGGAFVTEGTETSPEQLLAAADQALYEAKAAGRDRAAVPRSAVGV
jgi:diguanylate cyclase (GGDEF)-like protein